MWPLGIPLAMHVHLSTSPTGDVFSSKWTSGYRQDQDAGLPSLVWNNITFGDWNEKRVADFTVNLPPVSRRWLSLVGMGSNVMRRRACKTTGACGQTFS